MFTRPLRSHGKREKRRIVILLTCCLLLLLGSSLAFANFFQQHTTVHAAPPPSVNKMWYFADGRVGAGFQTFLTIGNPDLVNSCPATITYYTQGSVASHTVKPRAAINITIAPGSRFTEPVNNDLGYTQTQSTGELFSTIVSVNDASNKCQGIVVERPMYFSLNGVNSGSDLFGTTVPTTTNYFANIPVSARISTYISVFNPNNQNTNVTATYYANGVNEGQENLSVASFSRGTLTPATDTSLHLTSGTSVVISSDQPVVVERAIYRHQVSEGVVGIVSSASAVTGSPNLSNDWLFAEGYTKPNVTQEYLLVSNLSDLPAITTITLEYQNTHHQTLVHSVLAHSQYVLDVNQVDTNPIGTCDISPCATTNEVSAEVSTIALTPSLLVERQMFFNYSHTPTYNKPPISISATGGSEVVGSVAAMTTTTNFAEGYSYTVDNKSTTGYNEWLTLQNPTTSPETLDVTLLNEYHHSVKVVISIPPQNRWTEDITKDVRQNLLQSGEDYRAFQVSMSVNVDPNSVGKSFVAERPMYFHLNTYNIQGGDDVVGYNTLVSSPIVTPTATSTTGPNYACTTLNTSTLTSGTSANYITPGLNGYIWLTEPSANTIAKISPAGVVTEFTVPTANSQPQGITLGPDGNIWFTENASGKIGKITPTGAFTEYPISVNLLNLTSSPHPAGIVLGADGNLWFADNGTNSIGKISVNGTVQAYSLSLLGILNTNASLNLHITLAPNGNIWFVGSQTTPNLLSEVGHVSPNGAVSVLPSANLTGNVTGLTVGSDGNLWFIDATNDKVGYVTLAGLLNLPVSLGSGSNPYDITSGPDGNLWITQGNGNIAISTPLTTGTPTAPILINVGAGTSPHAITLGANGTVYVTDSTTGNVSACVGVAV